MKKVHSIGLLSKVVVYSVFISLSLFACKKHNSTPKAIVTTALDPQLKRNYFKVGSYWIYKNVLSGAIDSAFVAERSDSLRPGSYCDPHKEYFNEVFNMKINVVSIYSPDAPSNSTEKTWIISGKLNVLTMQVFDGKVNFDAKQKEMILARYPVQAGYMPPAHEGCAIGLPPADSAYVKDVLSSFTLNGLTFNNTIVSGHMPSKLSDPVAGSQPEYFYLSEDAGLVKIILSQPGSPTDRVLELQRYKIIR